MDCADAIMVTDFKEVILDYLGGSSLIAWALKIIELFWPESERCSIKGKWEIVKMGERLDLPSVIWRWRGQCKKECKQLKELRGSQLIAKTIKTLALSPQGTEFCEQSERAWSDSSLEPLEGNTALLTTWYCVTLSREPAELCHAQTSDLQHKK